MLARWNAVGSIFIPSPGYDIVFAASNGDSSTPKPRHFRERDYPASPGIVDLAKLKVRNYAMYGQITNVSPIDGKFVSSNTFDVRRVLGHQPNKIMWNLLPHAWEEYRANSPDYLLDSRKEGHLHS
jgi:hypothetical protein